MHPCPMCVCKFAFVLMNNISMLSSEGKRRVWFFFLPSRGCVLLTGSFPRNSGSLLSECLVTEDPQATCSWQRYHIRNSFFPVIIKWRAGQAAIVSYGKPTESTAERSCAFLQYFLSETHPQKEGEKRKEKKNKVPVEFGCLISGQNGSAFHPL